MEEKNFKRTTVTAALPYANGGVHIGHLAGVYVPADIYVRYLRLKNQGVLPIVTAEENPDEAVRAFLEGTLTALPAVPNNHCHEHDHDHAHAPHAH